ncbi:MAG: hypothetical protein QM756_03005 [Polyangiaceae bacterium]
MKPSEGRWLWCVALSLSVLLQVRGSSALPSQRCETIELVDHDGISRQLGLPKLIESLKSIPLEIVPNGVPADIRVDFTFSSGSGQILVAIRSWAEKEAVDLQSTRVPWVEDFQARRRTIMPMQEADAQAFREQIVAELAKQVEARTAAVIIASEPEGLPLVTTVPENSAAPLNRNRTVAVLGCLRDGAELEGNVTWPDGHREPFKRRANQAPGRFLVGSPAATERAPAPEAPPSTDADTVAPEPSTAPKPSTSSSSWRWWLGAALLVVAAWLARARIKNQ